MSGLGRFQGLLFFNFALFDCWTASSSTSINETVGLLLRFRFFGFFSFDDGMGALLSFLHSDHEISLGVSTLRL